MIYEVEQKFRVAHLDAIQLALRDLGAVFQPAIVQSDCYFAHPSRDFARTDEAFRIRRVGDSNYMTYKGPKIDRMTKTRREIELPLPSGKHVAEQFAELLAALGFSLVAEVRKTRVPAEMLWDDQRVEIALDDVSQVGHFVELEIQADQQSLAAARACLASLAAQLQLTENERRSYLELLLKPS